MQQVETKRIEANYLPVKRLLDVTAAIFLLLLFAPLILAIIAAIKIQSPGPIIFKQNRIGLQGRPFTMFKFRSMHTNNNPQVHQEHVKRLIQQNLSPKELGTSSLKLNTDQRITPIGKWIRALSLDELPQLINVLKGEMSIVGPRPPMPYEYELFKEWHKQRQSVLPGLTGLWQVTARNEIPFDDMVRLDLLYIEQMNLWQDLWIMVQTPIVMLKGKGGG